MTGNSDEQRPAQQSDAYALVRPEAQSGRMTRILSWLVIGLLLSAFLSSSLSTLLGPPDQAKETKETEQLDKAEPEPAPRLPAQWQIAAELSWALQHMGPDWADMGKDLDEQMPVGSPGSIQGLAKDIIDADAQAAPPQLLAPAEASAALQQLYKDVALVWQAGELTKERQKQFHKSLGWVAELAEAHPALMVPDQSANKRDALVAAATDKVHLISFMISLVVVLVIIGPLCAIWALRRWRAGRIACRFQVFPDPRAAYLSLFANYLLLFVLFPMVLMLLKVPLVTGIWAFLCLTPFWIAWMRSRGEERGQLFQRLGLHRGQGIVKECGAGLLGYLIGIPVILAGFMVTSMISVGVEVTHQGMENLLSQESIPAWQIAILAAGFAPLVEEIFFRGALFGYLRSRHTWLLSALISGVIFAAVHPQGILGIPLLASIAMVMAGIREWRGSLIGCITAHACHNGMIMIVVLGLFR